MPIDEAELQRRLATIEVAIEEKRTRISGLEAKIADVHPGDSALGTWAAFKYPKTMAGFSQWAAVTLLTFLVYYVFWPLINDTTAVHKYFHQNVLHTQTIVSDDFYEESSNDAMDAEVSQNSLFARISKYLDRRQADSERVIVASGKARLEYIYEDKKFRWVNEQTSLPLFFNANQDDGIFAFVRIEEWDKDFSFVFQGETIRLKGFELFEFLGPVKDGKQSRQSLYSDSTVVHSFQRIELPSDFLSGGNSDNFHRMDLAITDDGKSHVSQFITNSVQERERSQNVRKSGFPSDQISVILRVHVIVQRVPNGNKA